MLPEKRNSQRASGRSQLHTVPTLADGQFACVRCSVDDALMAIVERSGSSEVGPECVKPDNSTEVTFKHDCDETSQSVLNIDIPPERDVDGVYDNDSVPVYHKYPVRQDSVAGLDGGDLEVNELLSEHDRAEGDAQGDIDPLTNTKLGVGSEGSTVWDPASEATDEVNHRASGAAAGDADPRSRCLKEFSSSFGALLGLFLICRMLRRRSARRPRMDQPSS